MLPKKNRLSKKDFLLLKNLKPSYKSNLASVVCLKDEEIELSKISIIVSTKISKKAVVRNRIKRIYYNILSDLIGSFYTNAYLLYIVKKEVLEKSEKEIRVDIEKSLRQAKLLK